MHVAYVAAPCHASERLVVKHHRLPVCTRPHVKLDSPRARRPSAFERFDRVLRRPPVPPATAVPNDKGRRRPDGQAANSSAMDRAKAFASSTRSAGNEIAPTTGCPPPPWRSQMAATLCRRGTGDHGL